MATLLIKICAISVCAYIVVIAAMFFAQTWLTFPTFMVSAERPSLPAGASRIEIATSDGETLHGIRLPPESGARAETNVVIGFGGNGWHAEGLALDLRRHFPDRDIVAFDYRGYRPSTGRPSAAALLADSLVIHDTVRDQLKPARTIAVGYSLGSGVASYLARERPIAGMILVTPFDSLEAVAAQRYPWAPVRWLLRHRMSSVDFLRGLAVPTAVIAAERDEVIPPERTAALRRAVGNLVLDRTIAGARHNDIFRQPAFARAKTEAMAAIDARP